MYRTDNRYPYEIRLFLQSLSEYDARKLSNDVDHILRGHKIITLKQPFIRCSSRDCIHFKRSTRSEKQNIKEKQNLFNSNNFKDFIYISYLDRIHTQILHPQIDINMQIKQDAKKMLNSKYNEYPVYSSGLYIDYGYGMLFILIHIFYI